MQLHPSFAPLIKVFSSVIKWNDQQVQQFTAQLTVKQYKKGDYLLLPPQVCEHLFFLNSGFCKACTRDEKGKTRIIYFSGENEFTTDMVSFLSASPMESNIYCKVLQRAEIVLVPRSALEWIYNNIAEGNKLGRIIYQQYALAKMADMYDSYIPDPLERYKKLGLKYPDIEQRVSQKVIASYLNITPEYFSMLKAKTQRS